MTFVVASGCCNDASCVDVCPVDCIRPRPGDADFRSAEQLYIDPDTCIGCAACMYACPVNAIHDEFDLAPSLAPFLDLNADYFRDQPLDTRPVAAPRGPTKASPEARVALIGTGPAGCYALERLSATSGIKMDVFEQLPTPFGLIRSGVAPDHPTTKLISEHFQSMLQHPNVTCHFNVTVGSDVTLDELRASYHAVIYAGGASTDRRLGIDGEDLPGSHSAREFVAWYNGHPEHAEHTFNLSGDTAVVLGNGNVALDVARILASPPELLAATDIADHALQALRKSAVRHVIVVGRRGQAEAACTYSELLELSQLPGIEVATRRTDLVHPLPDMMSAQQKRKVTLFDHRTQDGEPNPSSRRITFRFGQHPSVITGSTRVESIELRASGSTTEETEILHPGLVIRAVGYRVEPTLGFSFDRALGTLAHREGRLVDEHTGETLDGLYCVGWAKRGPSGVIGTNRDCSRETVDR